MTEFEVVGKIHGKQRPRFANGHAYTPEQTRQYERHIALSYIGQGGKHHGNRIVEVLVIACIEPPKSWGKKKRAEVIGTWAAKKPDIDNVLKAVLDGLESMAYTNDLQVAHVDVKRIYGEREHLWITVNEL